MQLFGITEWHTAVKIATSRQFLLPSSAASTTDGAAVTDTRGGRRRPRRRSTAPSHGPPRPRAPQRSVEAEGRRQAAGPAPDVARQNRQETGSESFCDDQRGEPQTRGRTHLSDGSGLLYYTIRNGGDELLPRNPSEVDESLGEGLRRAACAELNRF